MGRLIDDSLTQNPYVSLTQLRSAPCGTDARFGQVMCFWLCVTLATQILVAAHEVRFRRVGGSVKGVPPMRGQIPPVRLPNLKNTPFKRIFSLAE